MKILDQAVISAAEARPSITEWECSMEDWLTAGHPGAARKYLVRDGNVELRPSRDCPRGEIRAREASPPLWDCVSTPFAGGKRCTGPNGHIGSHGNGEASWAGVQKPCPCFSLAMLRARIDAIGLKLGKTQAEYLRQRMELGPGPCPCSFGDSCDIAQKVQANQKCEWCGTRKNGSNCCGEELRQRNGELSENIIRLNGALRTAEERIADVQGCNLTLRTDLKSAMTCSAVTSGPLGPIRCERLRGDDHGQKHVGGGREWEDDFSGPEFDCDECKAKDAEIARMGAAMANTRARVAAQSITVGLPCRDIDFPLYEVSIDGVYWCRIPPGNVYRTGEGGYRFQRTTVKL